MKHKRIIVILTGVIIIIFCLFFTITPVRLILFSYVCTLKLNKQIQTFENIPKPSKSSLIGSVYKTSLFSVQTHKCGYIFTQLIKSDLTLSELQVFFESNLKNTSNASIYISQPWNKEVPLNLPFSGNTVEEKQYKEIELRKYIQSRSAKEHHVDSSLLTDNVFEINLTIENYSPISI